MNTPNATSLPGSADGHTLCDSRTGRKTGQSGQDRAHASHSARLAKEKEFGIVETFGPLFELSSPSASLQRCLESRLRVRMAGYGSPEFELTWKPWDMPAGPAICALRASGRRTSDSGCTGWHTPQHHDSSPRGKGQKLKHGTKHGCGDLNADAQLAAPGNPLAAPGEMTGWATPSASDIRHPGSLEHLGRRFSNTRGKRLEQQVAVYLDSGRNIELFHASTENRGALNPEHSRWLMGFPAEWGFCGATAMQSCRRSRRCSSRPASKPSET